MASFFRRLLQLPDAAAPLPAPSVSPKARAARSAERVRQLMELQSRVDFLEGEVGKLRGKITGGLAHRPKAQEEPQSSQEAPGSTIEPAAIPEVPQDRWMALASHRRATSAVLPR